MRMRNRAARRYLREVRSWLPCSRKLKRGILEKIGGTISEYLAEKPGADYDKLLTRFGTPQQIAASYVDEMETGELLRDLRIRRKIVGILTAVAATVVILWLGVVSIALIGHNEQMNGHIVSTIDEVERIPLDKGE